jgi:hypothetical protein
MEIRVLFEIANTCANAVVIRNIDETDYSYVLRTKIFQIACILGLLEEPQKTY